MTALDVGQLDGSSGLAVLLRRARARCSPGETIEVVTHARSAAFDVPALVKAAGHRLEGKLETVGAVRFRIARGRLAEVADAEAVVVGHAPVDSEFALRGTVHEGGRSTRTIFA